MKHRSRVGAGVLVALCLSLGIGSPAHSQTPSRTANAGQEVAAMAARAQGTFDVKLTPQGGDEKGESPALGRMSIAKQFHGDLEGTSKGEMLTAGTGVKDSGAYVAVERVTGKLNGRSGAFALQHSGTMTRGAPQLTITVVPDSGTGELTGLSGKMTIQIADGKHSYELEFTLPEKP